MILGSGSLAFCKFWPNRRNRLRASGRPKGDRLPSVRTTAELERATSCASVAHCVVGTFEAGPRPLGGPGIVQSVPDAGHAEAPRYAGSPCSPSP